MVGTEVTTQSDRVSGAGVSAWVVALMAGGAAAVRTFGSGLLLNWDQVIGPTIPVPPGFFGLGPELPRRVPFYGPPALISEVLGGPNVVALLVWATVTAACLGVVRLVGRTPAGIALGVVYGVSPFLLSRLAIGHLPLAVATALLPHALVDVADRRRRWVWALVFGFTGSSGTVIGLVPLAVATVRRERAAARFRSLLVMVAAQAVWVIPGLIVVARGSVLPAAASDLFRARVDGFLGPARAVAGGGLFLVEEDVAARAGWPAALLGLALLVGVAGLGRRHRASRGGDHTPVTANVPDPDLIWAAVIGLVLFVVPTLPGIGGFWDDVLVGPLVIVRETHKFWPLFGLALVVGVARVLDDRGVEGMVASGVLAILTVAVSWSGLWGAGGRLVPESEPEALAAVRAELSGGEHVTLALPWRRYGPSSLADGRTVLEPSPWLVDGRVIASGRAFASVDSDERTSTDAADFERLDAMVRAGLPVADELRRLRVDRVVVMGSPESDFYRRLGREPGVLTLVDGSDPGGVLGDDRGAVILLAIDGVEVEDASSAGGWRLALAVQVLALAAVVRLCRPVTASG